jgi:hypothetical protein
MRSCLDKRRAYIVTIKIEIASTPGLIDLDTGQPTSGEPYQGALEDFLSSNGVTNTDIELAVKEELDRAGQSAGEAFGWWAPIRSFFSPKIHKVLATEKQRVELAGYWLTLPDVPEAKVTLAVSVTDSTQRAASMKIAGVGGGPSFELTVQSGLQHEAASQERAVLSTMGTFQHIQVVKDGRIIGGYVRLAALDRNNVEWTYPAATLPPPAQLGNEISTVGYNLITKTSADTVFFKINRGTTWDFSAGINLPQFGGIQAGISGQVTYQQDTDYAYLLPPGRRYQAARFTRFPVYVWSVE